MKNKPAAMLALSPKGTVPVMVCPNGDILEESLDIMRWAYRASLAESSALCSLGSALGSAFLGSALVAQNDGHFKCWLDRYKYADRYVEWTAEESRMQASNYIRTLEARLTACPYLSGDSFGALDAAVAPFVRQFAGVEPAWFAQQSWPKVIEWLRSFKESQLLASVMVKQPSWDEAAQNSVVYSWSM